MKILIKFACLCSIVAMQSCSSEDVPEYMEVNDSNTANSKMVVRFGGKIYKTDVKEVGDSVAYINEEYAKLYRSKIANSPNIAAVLSSDEYGTTYVDYFPSEKELLENYDFMKLENEYESHETTRAGVIDLMKPNNTDSVIAVADLYRDKDYKNDVLIVYATTKWATAIPNLKSISFNDRVSSIRLINNMNENSYYSMGNYDPIFAGLHTHRGNELRPVLACYKDANYSGSVIYCIASPTGSSVDHTDSNLKKIKFNDKISSLGWNIVADFSLFEDKDGKGPKFPAHGDC